jgi:hypothetical protein
VSDQRPGLSRPLRMWLLACVAVGAIIWLVVAL